MVDDVDTTKQNPARRMRYGIVTANLGDYADPRVAVRLARAAEAAGWEAFFVWDHLGFVRGVPSGDPYVILSAVAASTTRLKLGLAITPLARRRPQIVANALASLDLLSAGRVIFGAGLGGVPEEFTAFGDPDDAKQRAAMLDEGLTILDRFWSGEAVTHRGPHYVVEGVSLKPLPLQRPRIPIWIGGEGRPALRRAARWDGWLAPATSPDGRATMVKSPERIAEMVATIRRHRTTAAPFEVAIDGYSDAGDPALPRAYGAAGATWWLESIHGVRGTLGEMLARVEAGPPCPDRGVSPGSSGRTQRSPSACVARRDH
jgi:alkanesulfonate monooxygenase SsuD/methylene tetrahydromethanopterin reductase-like flavin-dependent oxidoreductase (luciferase family)